MSIRRTFLATLIFTTAAASGWATPALAQGTSAVPQSCDDAFADVYFMQDAKKYPTGLPLGMTQGLPDLHLHLPRAFLVLGIGRDEDQGRSIDISPRKLCDRMAFAAVNAFYASTQDLARRLGLAYDPPSPNGDQLVITVVGNDTPVDDSADREGAARRGTWVLGGRAAPLYYFCLPPVPSPPSIHESCYVTADTLHMSYRTQSIQIQAQPFVFTTFDKGGPKFLKYIDTEDLNKYFVFLRNLVAVAIVTIPTPRK